MSDFEYNASTRGHLILKYLGTIEFELLQCQTLILAGGRRVRMVRIAQVTHSLEVWLFIYPKSHLPQEYLYFDFPKSKLLQEYLQPGNFAFICPRSRQTFQQFDL